MIAEHAPSPRGRQVPQWALALAGLSCLALGVALLLSPLRSLRVLTALVAAGLLLTGVSELLDAPAWKAAWVSRLSGALSIAAGIFAIAWPGPTTLVLAVTIGAAMGASGLLRLIVAPSAPRDERWLDATTGLTTVMVGVLSLAWPAITVLVIAVAFAIRTTLLGIHLLAVAARRPRLAALAADDTSSQKRSMGFRWAGSLLALVVTLGAATVTVALNRAQPDAPGAFYTSPDPLPDAALGTVLRSEIIDGYAANATTHRVLYLSTGYDGEPVAVSALVLIPDGPAPAGGRPVLAYTHGTTGVAPTCAPSLIDSAAQSPLFFEGGEALLDAGYIIAATDYQGLGTAGPHPYLVGRSEAVNALDSVRAAHEIAGSDASPRFAVWGHSQGGHASMFTGQLAAAYAPELELVGVAAGGPVPDLVELVKFNLPTPGGKILVSMALESWAEVYDADLSTVVTPEARPAMSEIASNCLLSTAGALESAPSALVLGLSFLSAPPWEVEPWATIATDNDPGQTPLGVPLYIVQSNADETVEPSLTMALAQRLCDQGERVELSLLEGVSHFETGHTAAPAVLEWITARFANEPAATSC